jgi:hypothetical protein
MEKLDHRFRNDGIFWMEYGDMLQTFAYIYRTRLFDEHWTVIQQWASCSVTWVTGYLRTKFILHVKKAGMFVIVMSQASTAPTSSSLMRMNRGIATSKLEG